MNIINNSDEIEKPKKRKNIPKGIGLVIGQIFKGIVDVFKGISEGIKEDKK